MSWSQQDFLWAQLYMDKSWDGILWVKSICLRWGHCHKHQNWQCNRSDRWLSCSLESCQYFVIYIYKCIMWNLQRKHWLRAKMCVLFIDIQSNAVKGPMRIKQYFSFPSYVEEHSALVFLHGNARHDFGLHDWPISQKQLPPKCFLFICVLQKKNQTIIAAPVVAFGATMFCNLGFSVTVSIAEQFLIEI